MYKDLNEKITVSIVLRHNHYSKKSKVIARLKGMYLLLEGRLNGVWYVGGAWMVVRRGNAGNPLHCMAYSYPPSTPYGATHLLKVEECS